jgi:hypothetical protein
LIKKVLPGKRVKYTCFGFAILSIVWTLADVLVTLFPCKFPDQWRFLEKECIDIFVFIQHVAATNICIEVIIIVMPLLVWNLRISAGRSISVSAVFMSRLLYVPAPRCRRRVLTLPVSSPLYHVSSSISGALVVPRTLRTISGAL